MNIDFSRTPILPSGFSNEVAAKVVTHMETFGVKTSFSRENCSFIGRYRSKNVIIGSPADLTGAFCWYGITRLEVILHEHIHALQHGVNSSLSLREYQYTTPLFQSVEDFGYLEVMKMWRDTYPHSSRFLKYYKGSNTFQIEWEAFTYARLLTYHLGGYVALEGELLDNVKWLMTSLGIS